MLNKGAKMSSKRKDGNPSKSTLITKVVKVRIHFEIVMICHAIIMVLTTGLALRQV